MLKRHNSMEPANTVVTVMDSELPLVKYGLSNVRGCYSQSSDLCQIIYGLTCDHSLFRILTYRNKRTTPKRQCIKSTQSANSDSEMASEVKQKTFIYNKVFKYLFSSKASVSVIDLTRGAWYLISPQVKSCFDEVMELIVLHCPLFAPSPLCDRILHLGSKSTTRTKIVIIGAGIAGLAAAFKLTQAGILDFKVLEAESAAGGRISSIEFGGGYVELGAQWIHGSNSMFYKFVRKKGLLSSVVSYEGEGHYLRKGGERIPDTLVSEIKQVIENILFKCEHFWDMSRDSAPSSVGKYLSVEFERYLQSCGCDSLDILRLKRELFDWHLRFQIIDNSCSSLEDVSAFEWGRFQSCGSENFNMQNNYSEIVDRLLRELPDSRVEYKRQVTSVDWNDIIKVTSCTPTGHHEYFADHLIVTCSVGVIKTFPLSFFSPHLPDTYLKGFRSIGFGTINKIFLHYKEAWWRDMQGMQLVWDSTKDKLPVDQEIDMAWTRGVTCFDLVSGLPTVLLCWVGGIGAELVEKLSDEVVAEHCTILLTLFTGTTVPRPTEIVRSKWYNNEQVRGSYSYPRVIGDQANINLSERLLTPIYTKKRGREVPSMLFAGEALHEKHYSTVHGAFETGLMQANKLVDFLLKTNSFL